MNVNLVLSGGGVRGYAHIGAVKALLERGVDYDAISATSSGAIVGAFLCDGFAPDEISALLTKHKPKLKVNFLHLRDSLLSSKVFADLLKKNLRTKKIEDLKKPLHIACTNLYDGSVKIFTHGNLVDVLTAASSLPVFFPPVTIDDVPYSDGGMSNNLPVEPFLGSSKKMVGIHVNPVVNYTHSPGLRLSIDRSMHIIVRNNILHSIKKCDVFIEPPELVKYHVFELEKADELVKVGYEYVKTKVDLSALFPNESRKK
jgi:NTE family protein